jgi:lysophospholipase L1-like esterase
MGFRLLLVVTAAGFGLLTPDAHAQKSNKSANSDHWVSTWATAQQLMPAPAGGFGGRGGPGPGPSANPGGRNAPAAPANPGAANPPAPSAPGGGATAQAAQNAARGPQGGRANPNRTNLPPTLSDQTIRMPFRVSLGGTRLRVEISNMASAQPLEVGAAHVGVYKGSGAIAPGTDRALTFSGNASVIVPPGALALSDAVNLNVAPLSDLAVSLYLPRDTGAPTTHNVGLHTSYISKGNVTGNETMPEPAATTAYVWLSSVDVLAPKDAYTIVALGDSITDGYSTTTDADKAWPTLLARRLSMNKATQHVAVVNQGISGNQVLRDGAGISALARFDRDVLSRPGVKWVVLLEGINDINIRGRVDGPNALSSDELIAGYRQLIDRCHMYGIKIIGATIMPDEGIPTATERAEGVRQAANRWIREKGHFDAVVDLDAAIRDPQRPSRVKQEYDSGDHIHPNDAGNQAMADAFDLTLFKK